MNGISIILITKKTGFEKLCLNDQMALLCNSWMEVLLTNVIYRTSLTEADDIVFFARGLLVYRDDLYSSSDWSASLLIFDQIMNVVNRFRPLKLSRGIVVVLKAMMLFNAGKRDLICTMSLIFEQSKIVNIYLKSLDLTPCVPRDNLFRQIRLCRSLAPRSANIPDHCASDLNLSTPEGCV